MTPNSELKKRAWSSLRGNWGTAIGVILMFWLLAIASGFVPFGKFLILAPAMVGLYAYFINLTSGKEAIFSNLFEGFDIYGKSIIAGLLSWLIKLGAGLLYFVAVISFFLIPFVSNFDSFDSFDADMLIFAGLWWKLFVLFVLSLPLIWVSIRLSQVYLVLAANPEVKGDVAIEISWKMMKGYEWKYLGLLFSFIGWYLLMIITLGIASLWALPYIRASLAEFYMDISQDFDMAPYLLKN